MSCYLVWLTWCTVTFTPDSETTRDPTEEYFSDRGIQIDLEPYHDLDLPRMSDTDQCSPPGTQDLGETWVPYTAVSILFIVLVQSSVTSWTSHPTQVLAGIKLGDDEDSDPGLCICCRPATRREPFPGPSSLPLAEEDEGQHMIRNERAQFVYSYSLCHITLCLANMYVTMHYALCTMSPPG